MSKSNPNVPTRVQWMLIATVIALSACTTQKYQPTLAANEPLSSYAEEISCPTSNLTLAPGATTSLDVTVKNTGAQPWNIGLKGHQVDLSYRWRDDKGNQLPIEGTRATPSQAVINPGESAAVRITVVAPPAPGSYTLVLSMVQEQVAWFFVRGATPLLINTKVS